MTKSFPLEPYWSALGRFVFEYAELEYVMNNALRVALGLTNKQTRVAFSGTRIRDAINLIKRQYEAAGDEMDPWLDKAFPKIAELTTVRDKLLHHGNLETPIGMIASDVTKNIPSKATGYLVTTIDLENMIEDAITARGCVVMFWVQKRFPRSRRYDGWKTSAERTWRYKLPEQAHSPAGLKKIAQMLRTQRTASRR
jgi:hypothetical protein